LTEIDLETKMSFLIKRLSSSRQELEDIQETFTKTSKEISGLYLKKYPNKKEINQKETEIEPKKEKYIDPQLKKLFKKISIKSHPDKLLFLDDEREANYREELFHKARQALQNNDIFSMIDVAKELKIKTPPITETQLKKVEDEIKDIKNKIYEIESTAVWHWFLCTDAEERKQMLSKIFELMHVYYTGA